MACESLYLHEESQKEVAMKGGKLMKCNRAAQLIYRLYMQMPSFELEHALQIHLSACRKCREIIEELGEHFYLGHFDALDGGLPKELVEPLSRIMRDLEHR